MNILKYFTIGSSLGFYINDNNPISDLLFNIFKSNPKTN